MIRFLSRRNFLTLGGATEMLGSMLSLIVRVEGWHEVGNFVGIKPTFAFSAT